jgi:WD40 repeat protein
VYGLAFSLDGRHLASGGGDHIVRIWDMASREEERCLPEAQDGVSSVRFALGGRYLAAPAAAGPPLCQTSCRLDRI